MSPPSPGRAPLRVLAATVVVLAAALAGPLAVPAAAAPADCFGGGTDLTVGTEGPSIDLTIYTSLFTNLTGPGAFGLGAVGGTGEHTVVTLRAGVVFAGVGDPAAFLADPFARFGLAFDYTLSLPMFEGLVGDSEYTEDDAPVSGVPEAECSVDEAGSDG